MELFHPATLHQMPNDNLNLMVIQYDTIIAMEEYGKNMKKPYTSKHQVRRYLNPQKSPEGRFYGFLSHRSSPGIRMILDA